MPGLSLFVILSQYFGRTSSRITEDVLRKARSLTSSSLPYQLYLILQKKKIEDFSFQFHNLIDDDSGLTSNSMPTERRILSVDLQIACPLKGRKESSYHLSCSTTATRINRQQQKERDC